ncbi:hypothetical protein FAES_4576 [Fibrella aestuarina BUZ 2]|uniref:DUF2064 domain-containing protein n=1 Tax=Fibrella aestuarina BUZ 2 TaxID=1166018 RepID=I0KEM2_9BACT|nr:DUF2064 domain-containing protein [Fibrella aestuarina]CCH02575.1 hypothetical protein FAES_4576 [Fibrella aestuarina BUZ 2]
MHSSMSSVAILLFARPAVQEAVCKPLTGARQRDERTWQALEALTWAKIKATNLPAFVSHQLVTQPQGDSFGRQLRRAAQAVLDQGYETVLCIGNDSPSLRVSDLKAAAQLAQSDGPDQLGTLPIGADGRGGVYLVGLNRASLAHADAFETLPWQTNQLASALTSYLRQQGQSCPSLTATHHDWNHRYDIRLGELVGEWRWLHALTDALQATRRGVYTGKLAFEPFRSLAPSGLRAPPLA